jgi:hypothetical protein
MKLTREGAARLGRHESRGFPVGDFEFQPEDFDGCFQEEKDHVVLTLEEAKKISKFFDVVECCASGFKLSDEERILWEIIEKRIEQVEGR